MTTISTVSSGNWSDPNIWNLGRVPQNLDDVIISNGHTVIFDVWMDDTNFPNGLNSLKIDGTSQTTILKASRTTNTRLKFYGNIYGSSRNYSIFDWGKEDDYIPASVQAEIIKNQAGKCIDGNNLQVFLYGADPGIWETQAIQSSPAGSDTIYVNTSNGFSINLGDKIFIEVERKNGDYICIKTVQSFNPQTGEIVLDSALPYAVDVGNYVLKISRNLKLIDLASSSDWQSFLFRVNGLVGNVFTKMGNFYFDGWKFCQYICNIIFSKISVISKSPDVVYGGNQNISLINSYSTGTIVESQNLMLKDSYLTREICRQSDAYVENCKLLNFSEIIYSGANIKSKNLLCRNGNVLFHWVNNWSSFDFKNVIMEKMNYLGNMMNGNFIFYSDSDSLYDMIFNFNNFVNVYSKTYLLAKGINSNKFSILNRYGKAYLDFNIKRSYDYSLKFEQVWNNNGAENPYMYLDFPFLASSDYTLSIYAQRDSNNTNAKIQIIEEKTDNIVAESNTLSNTNTWETLQVRYNFKKDKQYKIRLYAEGLGNVYWDVNPNDEGFFQRQIIEIAELEIIELPEEEFEIIELE